MPSAHPDDQKRMIERFGSIGTEGPIAFLEGRGFKLGKEWAWRKPGVSWQDLPLADRECIHFLAAEWDFGGFEDDAEGGTGRGQ